MLFQISERVLRVLKAITEPREAIKDVVKEPAHKSPVFRGRHVVRYDTVSYTHLTLPTIA
jgi:NADH-quinone oxidoreductase subunit I